MTRRGVTLLSMAILLVGLIGGGILGGASCTREVIEVPKVEVVKEVPMTLPALVQAIQKGEIDVGAEYGLAFGKRYHTIHATVLGLQCANCHVSEPDTTQTVFTAQDVSSQAPGPVDKRVCLGCHRAGPGRDVYDASSP